MALSLNTSHALYPHLLSLICVDDDGQVKDLVSGSLSVHASVTQGTGTYGRHFTTTQSGGGNAQGVTRTPHVPMCTSAAPDGSVFVALNSTAGSVYGARPCLVGRSSVSYAMPYPRVDASGNVGCGAGTLHPTHWTSGVNIHTGGAHSLCVVRTGTTSNQSYVDGGNASTLGGQIGFNDANGVDCIGGHPGTDTWGAVPASFVYVACFSKALTAGEIASLHSSLTGTNAFALVQSGDSTAPVLTAPTGVATGATTATVGATTDEANGTLYAVVTTSATLPSVAQIKAGQDHTGAAAPWGGSASVAATGARTLSATGLTAATAYYAHLVHADAAGNNSNRVSSALFNTTSVPRFDLTLPNRAFASNNGTPIASASVTFWVYNASTGALVATITGLSTSASGVVTAPVAHASLAPSTSYRLVWKFADGKLGIGELSTEA